MDKTNWKLNPDFVAILEKAHNEWVKNTAAEMGLSKLLEERMAYSVLCEKSDTTIHVEEDVYAEKQDGKQIP